MKSRDMSLALVEFGAVMRARLAQHDHIETELNAQTLYALLDDNALAVRDMLKAYMAGEITDLNILKVQAADAANYAFLMWQAADREHWTPKVVREERSSDSPGYAPQETIEVDGEKYPVVGLDSGTEHKPGPMATSGYMQVIERFAPICGLCAGGGVGGPMADFGGKCRACAGTGKEPPRGH